MRALLLALFVLVGACAREYPYPITKERVAALESIAQEVAARHCDELLKVEDCYDSVHGRFNEPDAPSLYMPEAPLGGDPVLKSLVMSCTSGVDQMIRCTARAYETWRGFRAVAGLTPIDCEWKTVWLVGKRDKDSPSNHSELIQPTAPLCKGPWGQVTVERVTPGGNYVFLRAVFAAPEAVAPGGPVDRLWTIEDNRDHDARLLCGDEGWEKCLAPDVDPRECLNLGLKSERGEEVMKALSKVSDPPRRSDVGQDFLRSIYYHESCSLPRQLREDPREHWRIKAEAANRRGPPRVIFDVRSDGPLTEKQVHATLSPALPAVTKCFDDARERLHNLRVGYLATNMKILPSGAVQAVNGGAMNNPKKDAKLFPCVAESFRTLKFPRKAQPSVIYVVTTDTPQ